MAERKTLNINETVDDMPEWAHQARDLGRSIAANPVPVAAGIIVVVLCLIAAGAIQLSRVAADRAASSVYAAAIFEEDDAKRIEALEAASKEGGRWGIEALYLLGEEAAAKGDWDKARNAFGTLVKEHATSPLAPRAAEGLAFIDETTGAVEQAIEGYRNIAAQWPDSFAGRCQPYNLGRALETTGNQRDAIAAYKNQSVVFPESKMAADAEVALARLQVSHPELFDGAAAPAEAPVTESEATASEAPAAEAAPAAQAPESTSTETLETAPAASENVPAEEAAAPAETVEETPAVDAPSEQ